MTPIGIGILCFHGLDDVKRCVAGIRAHTKLPYVGLIFDNSENDEVGEWARHHAADFLYERSQHNVGCAVARNRIAEHFARLGIERFVVMDQDVRPVADAWAADMVAVLDGDPSVGIVSWDLFRQQMASHTPTKSGEVPEMPGACCMYTLKCVKAVGGWCPEYFFYLFDTDFCLCARKAGYKVKLVWPDTEGVRHENPHRGVARHPRMARIKQASRKLFEQRCKELKLPSMRALG